MDIEKLLRDLKVLLEGHFLLNSGLHSKYYFEKFRILENPDATSKLCGMIVDKFRDKDIDWVIGPTTGGIVIAFEVARQLNKLAGFAEERESKRIVGRGFDIKNKKILLVDDVMTTGKSIFETIDAVKEKGGDIIGIAVLIDRCSIELPFEYYATYRKVVENFQPDGCPLCKEKVPLSKLGGA
ncbi:Orotate phosphoribosyltransferase [subsurface metagenome]|jgi:orotate phosphoribosyltransferase